MFYLEYSFAIIFIFCKGIILLISLFGIGIWTRKLSCVQSTNGIQNFFKKTTQKGSFILLQMIYQPLLQPPSCKMAQQDGNWHLLPHQAQMRVPLPLTNWYFLTYISVFIFIVHVEFIQAMVPHRWIHHCYYWLSMDNLSSFTTYLRGFLVLCGPYYIISLLDRGMDTGMGYSAIMEKWKLWRLQSNKWYDNICAKLLYKYYSLRPKI